LRILNDIAYVSMIFQLDFGTAPTVWYFLKISYYLPAEL
jgi:hypothetical protein